MPQNRRDSEASQSSLISYRSVENQSPGTPEHHAGTQGTNPDNVSPTHVSPSRHRVHFGTDLRYEYGDVDTESEGSPEELPPERRRSTQRSVDITEARPRKQSIYLSQPQGTDSVDFEKESLAQPSHTGIGDSLLSRLNQLRHAATKKARECAARLGRPPSDEGDVRAMQYRPESAVSSELTLSEKGYDHHRSSSEAHRLVRELSQDKMAYHRPGHNKHYPHKGPDYWGSPADAWNGAGIRRRGSNGGVLSQLLKLNGALDHVHIGVPSNISQSPREIGTPLSGSPSGTTTPRKMKWYKKPPNMSPNTLAATSTNISGASTPVSSEILTAASKRRSKQSPGNMRLEDEIQITLQIAQIIARERYIMQLCKALMVFGAPTHRLEEYMQMTAKVLQVDSQYLYVPGCMIMSFDDPSTRTAEVKLVRVSQGVDLGRLSETHNIYKNVIHDVIGIEEATQELEDIMKRKPRYNKLIIVLVCGLATAMVGPFAFGARPIDMPIIFCNGCLLGIMQHVIAPRSVLYSNVFEVTAAVLTSFIARAIGSITTTIHGTPNQYLFCFSAIAQSSIALILPGYTVLCSSLELQSHKIVPGSIRMVYAIIYSLFLGYGVTVGTTIYGLIDRSATSNTTCPNILGFENPYVARFPFVVAFSICLLIINQGKWKQGPVMVIIAFTGYVTNYFVTKRLGTNTQVANTVGAFAIGVMGNLYSRLWHGHAATAILPGIFVLVPSGLAASGSLIAGVESADAIRSNVTRNATHGVAQSAGAGQQKSVQDLGFGMVQVAIGITVGLFVAALVVYPLGKRRSGLFSF
ncbi:hypothetical protein ANOM_005701 [Aspergillus nomiae NRRL 13137]|uniref:DUF1212 domain membrane protein n=1 Tax=Aspergillus nomiae NRRL (strain ATCC 15546 / NRRL 13137 / CBS 260.88 / M93) TaxID=1509407 RepID=A0A0L1J5X6_ASPN3|nr:uncharacterized protein ANOM_005701 [Aspergillus nomiae NRRL 13137]KNG87070.1 hypothetical protein ANOM_005701 [Aspergillus nomiae NRRL 13137]